jgi:hypothetical protein
MANFINEGIHHNDIIISTKTSNILPKYIICNTFSQSTESLPFNEVKKYLNLGYNPEDIFILAPSVKSEKCPVRSLENLLKKNFNDLPIYVPCSDEEKLDIDILNNKLVFSTFHQVKGLERKVVFVYNFDESYHIYYNKNHLMNICPNELYVALTRASEHLIIFHHFKYDYLPFVKYNNIKKLTNFIESKKIKIKNKNNKTNNISVTNLVKHIPIEIMNKCLEHINTSIIIEKSDPLDIPIKISHEYGYENVSEITGTAIPAFFEYKNTNTMTIYNELIKHNKKSKSTQNEKIKLDFNLENINIDNLLYISNHYCSMRSGFLFKLYQIKKYEWLSFNTLNFAINRMAESLKISSQAQYEKHVESDKDSELLNKKISGYIDCIDGNNVYELKCVQKLDNTHILQLVIYMYLLESKKASIYYKEIVKYSTTINKNIDKINILKTQKSKDKLILINEELTQKINECKNKINNCNYNYYLYNILTNENIQIHTSYASLKNIIEILIYYKYSDNINTNDEEFINNMLILHNNQFI